MVSVLQWAVTYEHIPRYPTTALATAPGSDSVAFSPDGKILATWGAMQEVWPNELVWLWDVAGRRRIATFTVPSGSAARDQPPPAAVELAFSPGGKILAAWGDEERVWLWDVAGRQRIATITSPDTESVVFSPDGSTLAGVGEGKVWLWDVAGRRHTATITSPDTHSFALVAFSPDGKTLATGGEGIGLWQKPE